MTITGLTFVSIAAFVISVGSYLIALSMSKLSLLSVYDLLSTFKFNLFVPGIILNLIGSLFWASGRTKFTTYTHAWNVYLVLLVIFGSLVACVLNHEKLTFLQMIGIGIALLGMILISSK